MFQQQAESEGVQPNHSNNMSDSISEEPINRLPSNSGGSAHQPDQLSEPESEPEIWSAEQRKCYLILYNAARRGDWESARSFNERDPDALIRSIITFKKQTVLHVAAFYWQWEFILQFLELITSPESIVARTQYGETILHYVARGGSLKTAKALVEKNPDLLQIANSKGDLPLVDSIWSGNKKLVWYLSLRTRDDSPLLPRILRCLIIAGYLDIALYFVQRHPTSALANDDEGGFLLYWLATNPSYFFSGSNLGFLERWIYKFVHVDIIKAQRQHYLVTVNVEDIPEALQPRSFATQVVLRWFKRLLWKTITVLRWFKRLLWKIIAQRAPSVKLVRDAKLKHECADRLVNLVCTQLSSMSFQEIQHFSNHIMASALTVGNEEIVKLFFLHFPDLIDAPDQNILHAAIEHRQVNIVNIIKEIFPTATKNISSHVRTRLPGETILHLVGELAPPIKLLSVSGAALQMQRELQWFKEVEEIVFPDEREKKNQKEETPKEVFRRAHKELAKEGEKWMKDTANSCMLVSTLIATVLFAAVFTVPGGNTNDDKGIPIFLRTNAFTIFAISDALGLFSSLTSLLMFLAILTARYEMEDFLESLPKKLIIGLGSLFFAIAAMITTFGAALTIILSERWHRAFVPITVVASLPVAIFVMLQLPFFVQMVRSTYGASIFRPWPLGV